MSKLAIRPVVVVALCAALLVPTAAPAFADGLGTVPNHAIIGSTDLYGMTEDEARAAISQEASHTNLAPLKVKAAGKYFKLDARQAVRYDIDAMLASAYATSSAETTFTVARRYYVKPGVVDRFTERVARGIYRHKKSARYYVKSGRVRWSKAVSGRALYQTSARNAIAQQLRYEAKHGGTRPTLTLKYKTYTPAVTSKKLGRAILVDLSRRDLRLYDHSKVLKRYGVAIGMPAYPTPRGTFKIVAKVKNPTWRNPGSAWAANMPASIGPGWYNPLGTRALYLNAPGIRIHGTSKTGSIGTAASHGCIRVANANIQKLYPLVPVGTTVFIIR